MKHDVSANYTLRKAIVTGEPIRTETTMNCGTGSSEQAVNGNYVLLARAVVSNAVSDYVATKRVVSMERYVRRWMQGNVSGGKQWYKIRQMPIEGLAEFCKQERKTLKEWFESDGAEIAIAADVYHYIRWIDELNSKKRKTLQPRDLRKISENARYVTKILGE